jgi:hypothetical protein
MGRGWAGVVKNLKNYLFDPKIGFFGPKMSSRTLFFRFSCTQSSMFMIHSGPVGGKAKNGQAQWSARWKQPKFCECIYYDRKLTFFGTKSVSFGGWILFLLETFCFQ